ncbi:GNAT family N-acetyltransferase [Legionella pneumophila]|uniref:Acetyltransferase n=1 Tax=Legionella pneumophila subsp. pascullei TaxID=91890 RepID=A0AAX2IRS4_LEGPN|nr:GNAT family N-acetyltransferase [Legionella pneumophila]AMP88217.1 N-acetyltransferase [Legionella pneumophila subsp. pascullei]AMP91126.1 acetyltransferase [Legionella pneumophila subsp. pascullei]AMP94113.1 acetyltransferase [Legionella pneumophila subsp. pascullei]SQG88887.1 acetyltransferase [Legionella pneumophila subsp. pascullei]VEH03937.1 acetyltransferase [Legionella pneumophila subsp. pascullei]
MMNIRQLKSGDEANLETFLKSHTDKSMFLRSNLYHSGLHYQDKPFHGDYFASFDNSETITGVLAHYWNGNVIVQCPDLNVLRTLVDTFQKSVTREIAGILGEEQQADVVIKHLQLEHIDYSVNYPDGLYELNLQNLVMPGNTGGYQLKEAKHCDKRLLYEWFRAYHIEALGAEDDSSRLKDQVENEVKSTLQGNERWILEVDGIPVSLCGFNARLPDIVQIGPVWTPVDLRGRGYARTVVALSLDVAKKGGVSRAVLFTNNEAAVRAYQAVGFNKVGNYRLAILKKPIFLKCSL